MSDPVRAIADAVLYEGYILWPYRRSALKNQRRFTFGGVYPPAHSRRHPDDPATMRAQVLIRGDATVKVTVRFLHVVQRMVLGGDGEPVDERVVNGERYLSWEEAAERSIEGPGRIAIPAGTERENFLVRTWEGLEGEVAVDLSAAGSELTRVSVTVTNTTAFPPGGDRQEALKRTFCSTHMLLQATGAGAFVSLTDPPPELSETAEAARAENVGCWPILVGESEDATTMLAAPIILEDHPRIAPESPGDLFDGGEIDQLLVLNILAMTDEEKAEMAASDARAREILERTEALTTEQLMALHGRTVLR